MVEPRSPFLPTPEELEELDRKDGFDRSPRTNPDVPIDELSSNPDDEQSTIPND